MRDLCNTDKPLFAVLTKLTYSAYLNILWLVCSLPIVTIGASTTALFYVTLKMAEDRDDGLTRMFFKAFRENFKPATKLWLILLAVGSFLAADGFVLRRMWSEIFSGRCSLQCLLVRQFCTASFCCMLFLCWHGLKTPPSAS